MKRDTQQTTVEAITHNLSTSPAEMKPKGFKEKAYKYPTPSVLERNLDSMISPGCRSKSRAWQLLFPVARMCTCPSVSTTDLGQAPSTPFPHLKKTGVMIIMSF